MKKNGLRTLTILFLSLYTTVSVAGFDTVEPKMATKNKDTDTSLMGGVNGGGGSYVLVDGRITLADPYYAGAPVRQLSKIKRVTFAEFPTEIQDYVVMSLELCMRMQACDYRSVADLYKIINTKEPRYFLVPKDRENNVPCDRYLPILNRKVDAHFQYGCTLGPDTYLFIDKWSQAPIEDQALAVIHERLWASYDKFNQKDISNFIKWLYIYSRRFVDQSLRGDKTPLPAHEIIGYEEFKQSSRNVWMNFVNKDFTVDFDIISGGAVIARHCMAKTEIINSFIGIGSEIYCYINQKSLKIEDSFIFNTKINIDQEDQIIKNSQIKNSSLEATSTYDSNVLNTSVEDYKIYNSDLTNNTLSYQANDIDKLKLKPKSILHHTIITNSQIKTTINSTGSELVKNKIDQFIQGGFGWSGVLKKVLLEEGVLISNFHQDGVASMANFYIKKNSQIKNLTIQANNKEYQEEYYENYSYHRYALVINPNTSLSNGTFDLITKCEAKHGDVANKITFGSEKNGYTEDLMNKTVTIKTSTFNCKKQRP